MALERLSACFFGARAIKIEMEARVYILNESGRYIEYLIWKFASFFLNKLYLIELYHLLIYLQPRYENLMRGKTIKGSLRETFWKIATVYDSWWGLLKEDVGRVRGRSSKKEIQHYIVEKMEQEWRGYVRNITAARRNTNRQNPLNEVLRGDMPYPKYSFV